MAEQLENILTPRQLEVLHLMHQGLSNKEIAEELGVEETTVETFASQIYTRLDVGGRVEAAVIYERYVPAEA